MERGPQYHRKIGSREDAIVKYAPLQLIPFLIAKYTEANDFTESTLITQKTADMLYVFSVIGLLLGALFAVSGAWGETCMKAGDTVEQSQAQSTAGAMLQLALFTFCFLFLFREKLSIGKEWYFSTVGFVLLTIIFSARAQAGKTKKSSP